MMFVFPSAVVVLALVGPHALHWAWRRVSGAA
jgi:hypothetical protein